MSVNCDYEELFKILNGYRIKYLVVGAYAVMYYSEPRFTKDLDIWIIPDMNNDSNVFKALKKFGAPLRGLHPKDFADKQLIFQIGVAPVRIDIMMDVPGVSFQTAWKNRKKTKYGKTPINIIGVKDLIKAKKKARRPQDKLDIEKLKNI